MKFEAESGQSPKAKRKGLHEMTLKLEKGILTQLTVLALCMIVMSTMASLAQSESSPVAVAKGDGTSITFVYHSDIKGKIEECG
jgi:hypothetical protein